MAIFVDELRDYGNRGKWCHMWSDTSREELDSFALSIGLKKEWAQVSILSFGEFYHYDLTSGKREQAMWNEAKFMRARTWIMNNKIPISNEDE